MVGNSTEIRLPERPAEEISIDSESLTEASAPGVTYEDIGGLDDELERVREMIELPMRHTFEWLPHSLKRTLVPYRGRVPDVSAVPLFESGVISQVADDATIDIEQQTDVETGESGELWDRRRSTA